MDNLFNHTVLVQSFSSSTTPEGTYDPEYSTRFAALKCLLQHENLRDFDRFNKLTVTKIVRMFCSYQPTITEKDRVVSTEGKFAGTYEITGIEDAGGQANHLEIELRLVE